MSEKTTAESLDNKQEKLRPIRIITAKGSVYTYLPDGRTQRYKKATGESMEPMDLIVFVPPWDVIKDKIPKKYDKHFINISNDFEYDQLMLEYIHSEDKTVRVTDEKGKILKTQEEVDSAQRVFMAFFKKDDVTDIFYLPVVKDVRIGFSTFDMKFSPNNDGTETRVSHLGNRVVDIEYPEV